MFITVTCDVDRNDVWWHFRFQKLVTELFSSETSKGRERRFQLDWLRPDLKLCTMLWHKASKLGKKVWN